MNKLIFILSYISLAFVGCSESVDSNRNNCEQKIIIDSELYNSAPNDDFRFRDIEITGNCLKIIIEYGGGCGNAEAKLIGSEFFENGKPPQREIRLSFKDEDYCKALITKELFFSLLPAQVTGEHSVVLRMSKWNDPIVYNY